MIIYLEKAVIKLKTTSSILTNVMLIDVWDFKISTSLFCSWTLLPSLLDISRDRQPFTMFVIWSEITGKFVFMSGV